MIDFVEKTPVAEIEKCTKRSVSYYKAKQLLTLALCAIYSLIGEHPNTYTFSKQLAEHLLFEEREHIKVAIVRPSIGKIFNKLM
jgi:nucleoside-diphosphate-sugar epimerase